MVLSRSQPISRITKKPRRKDVVKKYIGHRYRAVSVTIKMDGHTNGTYHSTDLSNNGSATSE
jgi:hypothetical protein